MRPLKVKVKGFTAFADEVDLDFAGLDLFAITGPTGAGKTSLIQAIPIALFGRAPKVANDLRQLISPSTEQARFYYEFLARGGRYRTMFDLQAQRFNVPEEEEGTTYDVLS